MLISYSFAKYQTKAFPAAGISGKDIHKVDSPVRAEMGGLAVLLALAVGATLYLAFDYGLDGPIVLFAGTAARFYRLDLT